MGDVQRGNLSICGYRHESPPGVATIRPCPMHRLPPVGTTTVARCGGGTVCPGARLRRRQLSSHPPLCHHARCRHLLRHHPSSSRRACRLRARSAPDRHRRRGTSPQRRQGRGSLHGPRTGPSPVRRQVCPSLSSPPTGTPLTRLWVRQASRPGTPWRHQLGALADRCRRGDGS
jgi:hypothetical protein